MRNEKVQAVYQAVLGLKIDVDEAQRCVATAGALALVPDRRLNELIFSVGSSITKRSQLERFKGPEAGHQFHLGREQLLLAHLNAELARRQVAKKAADDAKEAERLATGPSMMTSHAKWAEKKHP